MLPSKEERPHASKTNHFGGYRGRVPRVREWGASRELRLRKAKTPDEKAICANRSLSDLDLKMATLFGVHMKLPMLMGARGAAQDEQRDFLTVRGSCGADAACIGIAYQQRIDAINAEIDAAMQDYCVKLGICG